MATDSTSPVSSERPAARRPASERPASSEADHAVTTARSESSPEVADQPTRTRRQGGERVPGPSIWEISRNVLIGLALVLLIGILALTGYRLWYWTPSATTQTTHTTTQQGPANPASPANVPAPTSPVPTAPGAPLTPAVPTATTQTPGAPAVPVISVQPAPASTTHVVSVDPAALVGTYATSTVSKDDATNITVRKHKDNKEVLYFGDGKHMPRQVHVYSCPQVAPIQVHVPVPSVENKIYLQPPVPPTPPTPPAPPTTPTAAPSAPAAPQVRPAATTRPVSYVPAPHCQRVVYQRNYGN